MSKYAIYTAVVGGYDEILQPEVIDDRFDYILFSNDIKEINVGVWQVCPINYHNDIQTKIARWVKTHPEELLPDYDFCVWIDSNIRIVTDYIYKSSIDLFYKGVLLSALKHSKRKCVYDEIAAVLRFGYETDEILMRWGRYLRLQKYPRNNGLNETGILYRVHSNKDILNFDNLWWYYIEKHSRRDQLSFNYVMYKLNMTCPYILPKGEFITTTKDFEYNPVHRNESNKRIVHNKVIMRIVDSYGSDILFISKFLYFAFGTNNVLRTLSIIGIYLKFRKNIRYFAKKIFPVSSLRNKFNSIK